ncbi:hypothetical protein ACSS6W_006280 [Trichoderma asperelloides]
MGTLANVYRSQRRIEEAENLEKRTLELRSIFLGVNHPRTLMSMQDRARRYCARGQFKMAEDLMLQILELQRGVLRVDHPDIISSMILLANICRDLGKLDVAIRLMESCLSVHKAELGQNHRQTVGLVVVLEKWRREAEICAVNSPRRAWRRRYQSADVCEEEEEEEEAEEEEDNKSKPNGLRKSSFIAPVNIRSIIQLVAAYISFLYIRDILPALDNKLFSVLLKRMKSDKIKILLVQRLD